MCTYSKKNHPSTQKTMAMMKNTVIVKRRSEVCGKYVK